MVYKLKYMPDLSENLAKISEGVRNKEVAESISKLHLIELVKKLNSNEAYNRISVERKEMLVNQIELLEYLFQENKIFNNNFVYKRVDFIRSNIQAIDNSIKESGF